nr:MAG TPA: hypothetical protein [Caudoviricetes sp.]
MTKDEIKKALECCEKYAYCKDCPCYTYCEHELHKGALALITEQEKEIDFQVQDRARLQREIDELEQAHEQRVEEIKRLKAENTTLYEVRNNLLEENDKLLKDNVALILGKKQAQIDVLNELRKRITKDRVANDTVVINANYEIKELIKEVQNGEDKG